MVLDMTMYESMLQVVSGLLVFNGFMCVIHMAPVLQIHLGVAFHGIELVLLFIFLFFTIPIQIIVYCPIVPIMFMISVTYRKGAAFRHNIVNWFVRVHFRSH